jgi:hypothetical protein
MLNLLLKYNHPDLNDGSRRRKRVNEGSPNIFDLSS